MRYGILLNQHNGTGCCIAITALSLQAGLDLEMYVE
jgi:hypothetical protein